MRLAFHAKGLLVGALRPGPAIEIVCAKILVTVRGEDPQIWGFLVSLSLGGKPAGVNRGKDDFSKRKNSQGAFLLSLDIRWPVMVPVEGLEPPHFLGNAF